MLLTPGFHKERLRVTIISESGCRECGCLKKAQTGQIRKARRVDHKDAFLDNEEHAHWYQTPLHFYLQIPIAQIHDYSMARFEHWTKETFSANFRKMLMLEQYRDPKLAQLHHDYLAGGPLKYMAVIFRKLADSDETAMQLALEFYL